MWLSLLPFVALPAVLAVTDGPLSAGNQTVPRSLENQLLRIARAPSSWPFPLIKQHWATPAARSYDGHAWEPALDPLIGGVRVHNCSAKACTLHVPAINGTTFHLVVDNLTAVRPKSHLDSQYAAAKLLAQATFGPTKHDVAQLSAKLAGPNGSASAFSEWIDEQIAAPATLHRAYFRARTTPRGDMHTTLGGFTTACRAGSMWHRYALSHRDVGAPIVVTAKPGGALLIAIGGAPRTLVPIAKDFDVLGKLGLHNASSPPWRGTVCLVVERVGAHGSVAHNCSTTNKTELIEVSNVNLTFASSSSSASSSSPSAGSDGGEMPAQFLDVTAAAAPLKPVLSLASPGSGIGYAPTDKELFLLEALHAPCPLHGVVAQLGAFMRRGGVWYKHDARLAMTTNTLESPANLTMPLSHLLPGESCPRVAKNFLNAHTCVRRPACAAVDYSKTAVPLSHATMRKFYEVGGIYLYALDGLRLEGDARISPCHNESRWVSLHAPCGSNTSSHGHVAPATPLDDETRATLADAVRGAPMPWRLNQYVRDTTVNIPGAVKNGSCTTEADGVSAIGARVEVDGVCWQHSHARQLNVYDATAWRYTHDGSRKFGPGANPIEAFAKLPAASGVGAQTTLRFPKDHTMDQWTTRESHIRLIGALGANVTFDKLPSSTQSPSLAAAFGANATLSSDAPEVCGSPGEVANDPTHNHLYPIFWESASTGGQYHATEELYRSQEGGVPSVWPNVAFKAPDQLRQRMAWALSQTFVISEQGYQTTASESWLAYYDIFVRNAFGNLRNLLREISYSAMMAHYLSFYGSRSKASKGTPPDENYGRELMQLFTIGLVKLRDDGTVINDAHGKPIPTYDTQHMMAFSRAWTGFGPAASRDNLGLSASTLVDPMVITNMGSTGYEAYRDLFPKVDLNDGHLGDRYPLCSDLPRRSFLRAGARYSYLGRSPYPKMQFARWTSPALLLRNTSALYRTLCNPANPPRGAHTSGGCTFLSEVTLEAPAVPGSNGSAHGGAMPCDGAECHVDTLIVVGVQSATETVYYEYLRPPCVELAFYDGGRLVQNSSYVEPWAHGEPVHPIYRGYRYAACADPSTAAAGVACCASPTAFQNRSLDGQAHTYRSERVTYATAAARCNASDQGAHHVCRSFGNGSGATGFSAPFMYSWTSAECGAAVVQVDDAGLVTIVHPASSDPAFQPDSGNELRVRWAGGRFPSLAKSAGANGSDSCVSLGCRARGSSCMCSTKVVERAVFTDVSAVPTQQEIEARLTIGSADPATFDGGVGGTYRTCASAACAVAAKRGVAVYLHKGSTDAGKFDETTIFAIKLNGTRLTYLANKESTVVLNNTGAAGPFEFRNPPTFHSFALPSARDAAYETEALLDHLFYHANTAPFVVSQLIQRLITSNPSPRYVAAAVAAFKTGAHAGKTYSGRHGDLAAAVAAILLDPEARSPALDLEPAAGKLREPLVKLIGLLRSLEYTPSHGGELDLPSLEAKLGEQVFDSPTVFNFYFPNYSPDGAVSDAMLHSPEAQILNAPTAIAHLNGASSLVKYGLASCSGGFGMRCAPSKEMPAQSDGVLGFSPALPPNFTRADAAQQTVAQLDVLLTGGRLHPANRAYVTDAVAAYLGSNLSAARLRGAVGVAEELFAITPEFHATTFNARRAAKRAPPAPPPPPPPGRGYKALVYLYLDGGADTYSHLVPLSGCGAGAGADLFAQYSTLKGPLAYNASTLRPIDASTSKAKQPCSKFGLHPQYDNVSSLYAAGELGFVANVGPLVEPLTPQALARGPQLPQLLFAHTTQKVATQTVHAQAINSAKGVLARLATALATKQPPAKRRGAKKQAAANGADGGADGGADDAPFNAMLYSISGNAKAVQGGAPPKVLTGSGAVRWNRYAPLKEALGNLTAYESGSIFAEAAAAAMQHANQDMEALGAVLDATTLPGQQNASTKFDTHNPLSLQLEVVSKVIKARAQLHGERDLFFVSLGGWDTHTDQLTRLQKLTGQLDEALGTFVAQMKLQGVWESVSLMSASEFGRTITNNGFGTDHGWGGHALLAGGAVRGGRLFGRYPSTLIIPASDKLQTRGRFIPTTPWEAVFNAQAQWLGVRDEALLAQVLPNRANFAGGGILLAEDDVFKAAKPPSPPPPTTTTVAHELVEEA